MSDTPVEINYDEPRPASSHRSRLRNLYFLCRMREMINFVLLQSNLIEKLSSFNCQRHPRPHSPQPVWTISVPFCPKWYLTAAVAAADSCAILRPAVTAVRTSPQPPATTQLLVTFGDGKLFWQTWMSVARTPWDSYVITWAWPPDVTLCDRGGGWCELVSAPRQCQLSSVLRGQWPLQLTCAGPEYSESRRRGVSWDWSLVTVSPSCVTDHQASWSGPWLTGILWEWECGIQKRHATVPVPRIITGPRRFPFGRIRAWLRASRFVVKKSTNRGPSAERQIDITISSYSGNWTQTDKHREAGGKWRNFVKTNKQIWEQNFDAVLPRQKLTSCLKLATLMTPTWHKQSQDKKRERQSNAAGWSVSIIVRISHKALQA